MGKNHGFPLSFLCPIGSLIKEKVERQQQNIVGKNIESMVLGKSVFDHKEKNGCSCFWDVKRQELDFTQEKSGTCLMIFSGVNKPQHMAESITKNELYSISHYPLVI